MMKNVIAVFLGDIRNLAHNAIAAIVVVGLILVPPMYAWFTTLGFWDPYSNTGNLSVAVANEDEGYQSDLLPMKINAGDNIIDALRANHQFDWKFVDSQNAIDGVKSGEYYAAIVMPKDFSANLMTVFTDDIKNSEIVYYSNEKENAIAPRITDTGATALQTQIDETFTKTVAGIALDTTSNLSNFMTGDGIANYAAQLERRLDDTVSILQAATTDVEMFEGIVSSTTGLIDSTGKILGNTGNVEQDSTTILSNATKGLDDARSAFEGTAKVANSATKDAGSTFDVIRKEVDSIAATMKDDPATAAKALDALKDGVNNTANEYNDLAKQAASAGLSPAITDGIKEMSEALSRLASNLGDASSALRNVSNDASNRFSAVQSEIDSAQANITNVENEFDTRLKTAVEELNGTLSKSIAAGSEMGSKLAEATHMLSESSGSITNDLNQIQRSLHDAAVVLKDSSEGLDNMNKKLKEATASGDLDEVRKIIGNNPDAVASFLSAPITLDRHAVYEMPNNGSAMSPFYTSLSLWIGAIFLVALTSPFVSEKRKATLNNPKPWQMYLGRYLIFGLIAIMQALVVCIGNVFFLGIECQHFWLYLIACLVTAVVFSNVVYTLTISFGNVGKAIAIILLVLQLAGSGGIFPVQMSAEFFQYIYPWLPFAHSMEMFEGAMAGIYGMQFADSTVRLALLLVPSLLLGLVLRRPIIKMNNYINRKLDETKLV